MSENLLQTREKLNSVSSCFCIAKWSNVTLHLESGTTHSCHHPRVHKVPLEELEANPAALHNTRHKIEQRKKMMAGERPTECEYCWNIEDLKTNELSDRILKSAADWSVTELDGIVKNPLSTGHKPRYMEVSFSNTCQFKCSYCSADYSSTWEEEIKKFGPYTNGAGKKTNITIKEDDNAYIRAFWQWWPELKKDLHTFRITGGEPLLSPNTFRILENVIEHPLPHLNLSINSNLGAPQALLEKFIGLTKTIQEQKCIRRFDIFTSIDAYGTRAEYIRHGLKHDYFWDNVERLLKISPRVYITIMCTFNALSVTSFTDLMKKVISLNDTYRTPGGFNPVLIDIAYLRYPRHQTVQALPATFAPVMEKNIAFIQDYISQNGAIGALYNLELVKLNRILGWMKQPLSKRETSSLRKDFYDFFAEHDRRRGTSFLQTFPEMKSFWASCRWHSYSHGILFSIVRLYNYFKGWFKGSSAA